MHRPRQFYRGSPASQPAQRHTRRANSRWQCGHGSVLVLLPDCFLLTLPLEVCCVSMVVARVPWVCAGKPRECGDEGFEGKTGRLARWENGVEFEQQALRGEEQQPVPAPRSSAIGPSALPSLPFVHVPLSKGLRSVKGRDRDRIESRLIRSLVLVLSLLVLWVLTSSLRGYNLHCHRPWLRLYMFSRH